MKQLSSKDLMIKIPQRSASHSIAKVGESVFFVATKKQYANLLDELRKVVYWTLVFF